MMLIYLIIAGVGIASLSWWSVPLVLLSLLKAFFETLVYTAKREDEKAYAALGPSFLWYYKRSGTVDESPAYIYRLVPLTGAYRAMAAMTLFLTTMLLYSNVWGVAAFASLIITVTLWSMLRPAYDAAEIGMLGEFLCTKYKI